MPYKRPTDVGMVIENEAKGIIIGFVLTAIFSGFAMNSVCGGLAVLCGLISLTAAINYLKK